jgi:hypothetical protein
MITNTSLILVLFLFFTNFSEGTEHNKNKEPINQRQNPLPPARALDPYNMDLKKPVTAKNLVDEISKWDKEWKDKEVSVIAWAAGGVSGGSIKTFSNSDQPGVIVLSAEISPAEEENMGKYASSSPYIIIKGIAKTNGRSLSLSNCQVTGTFSGTFPGGEKLNPTQLTAQTPVNALDILHSMNAWKGVEVVIKDKCSIPMSGNTVSFPNDKAVKDMYGLKPDFIRAVLKTPVKNVKPVIGVKTVKGKVNKMDQATGEVSLHSAEILL